MPAKNVQPGGAVCIRAGTWAGNEIRLYTYEQSAGAAGMCCTLGQHHRRSRQNSVLTPTRQRVMSRHQTAISWYLRACARRPAACHCRYCRMLAPGGRGRRGSAGTCARPPGSTSRELQCGYDQKGRRNDDVQQN